VFTQQNNNILGDDYEQAAATNILVAKEPHNLG